MPEPWPEWVRPAFELRFLERSIEAFNLDEVNELAQQQDQLATDLKLQLTPGQYRQILEWEENLNFRSTIEKEWLYFAGLRDGLTFWKHLASSLPDE